MFSKIRLFIRTHWLTAVAVAALALAVAACVRASQADRFAHSIRVSPPHKFGAMLRETTLAAGTGISTAEADLANCQAQWTVTNTSPGGGGVTSVTGAAGTNCSPTTGAVTCTTAGCAVGTFAEGNGTGNPLNCVAFPCNTTAGCSGISAPTAHDIPITEGSSPFNLVSCAAGKVLTGVSAADPACNSIDLSGTNTSLFGLLTHSNGGTDLSTPGNSGNLLVSNGTNWTSAFPSVAAPQILSCQASSVQFNGTSNVTVCSISFTTPNDSVTHHWLLHEDISVWNTVTTSWTVSHGFGVGSTSFSTNSVLFLDPGSSFAAGKFSRDGSWSLQTTIAPNTAITINLLAALDNTGAGTSAEVGNAYMYVAQYQ